MSYIIIFTCIFWVIWMTEQFHISTIWMKTLDICKPNWKIYNYERELTVISDIRTASFLTIMVTDSTLSSSNEIEDISETPSISFSVNINVGLLSASDGVHPWEVNAFGPLLLDELSTLTSEGSLPTNTTVAHAALKWDCRNYWNMGNFTSPVCVWIYSISYVSVQLILRPFEKKKQVPILIAFYL